MKKQKTLYYHNKMYLITVEQIEDFSVGFYVDNMSDDTVYNVDRFDMSKLKVFEDIDTNINIIFDWLLEDLKENHDTEKWGVYVNGRLTDTYNSFDDASRKANRMNKEADDDWLDEEWTVKQIFD